MIDFSPEQPEDGAVGDEDDYGGCPVCGGSGDMLNDGRHQWMVCHEHEVKWYLGVGFFSLLQRGRRQQWDQAKRILAGYREVRPAAAPPDDEEARFRRLLES